MRIITVNLPVKDIKTIKSLVGEHGLFPSRSELIRVAIRDFLVKELHVAKNFYPKKEKEVNTIVLNSNAVRIPYEEGGETTWKTFKIIQK